MLLLCAVLLPVTSLPASVPTHLYVPCFVPLSHLVSVSQLCTKVYIALKLSELCPTYDRDKATDSLLDTDMKLLDF